MNGDVIFEKFIVLIVFWCYLSARKLSGFGAIFLESDYVGSYVVRYVGLSFV